MEWADHLSQLMAVAMNRRKGTGQSARWKIRRKKKIMCARRIKESVERVALGATARSKLKALLAHGISNACFLGQVGGTIIPVALPPARSNGQDSFPNDGFDQPGANPPAFTIELEPPLPAREIPIPIHTDD
jgi:hypothetical protein